MKKRIFLLSIAFILLPLFSCGEVEKTEEETEALEPSPLPVTAVTAAVDTLYEVVDATGRVSSARTQQLTAQVQGEVILAPEYEGVTVYEGDAVFCISSGEENSQLASAVSEFRNAELLYEFECDNYRRELTSEITDMLKQTTGYYAAQASLARAQTQYANTVITAGFDGVISDISAQEGLMVYPGSPLGEIIDPQNLQVEINLDERELADCTKGQKVYLSFPSLGESIDIGIVESVAPVVNPSTRSGKVIIVLPPVDNLRAGATAKVEIVTEVFPEVLIIPEVCVLIRDGRDMVFTVTDNHADWRYVTLGAKGRGYTEVIDGISDGETVITSGHYSLAHDAPVAVVN